MIINNTFIFTFLFLIGLFLFSMITWLEYNLPTNFILSNSFWLSLRILLVLSTIFIILPISFLLCNKSCNYGLLSSKLTPEFKSNIYLLMIMIIGIIIIVCGTIIKAEIDTDINEPAWGIIGMGISLLLLSISLIAWKYYKNIFGKEAKRLEAEYNARQKAASENSTKLFLEQQNQRRKNAEKKKIEMQRRELAEMQKTAKNIESKRQKEQEIERQQQLIAKQTKKAQQEVDIANAELRKYRAEEEAIKIRKELEKQEFQDLRSKEEQNQFLKRKAALDSLDRLEQQNQRRKNPYSNVKATKLKLKTPTRIL